MKTTIKKLILDLVSYEDHNWRICCDLKVVAMLVGLKKSWPSFPCFLCKWHSRFKTKEEGDIKPQYNKKTWDPRDDRTLDYINKDFSQEKMPLIERDKIMLPLLHMKLGIVSNFIKVVVEYPDVLACLKKIFPALSERKLKAGIFHNKKMIEYANCNQFNVFYLRYSKWSGYKKVDEVR